MNRDFRRITENALAQVGIFAEIGNMTPHEILLLLDAQAKRLNILEDIAWRIGQYVAIAIHSPAHYPQPPRHTMSDDELQTYIQSIAQHGKE